MAEVPAQATPVRIPSKARFVAIICIAVSLAALTLAMIPFGVDYQSEAMRIWQWAALTAGLGVLVSLVGLLLVLVKRCGWGWIIATLMALLISGYLLMYALVAGVVEHARSRQHGECAYQLHTLRLAVLEYGAKYGKHPQRLEDMPTFDAIHRDWRSPGSNEKLVLWPTGVPANPPGKDLPDNIIIAAEPSANQQSHWIALVTPLPSFKSTRPPDPHPGAPSPDSGVHPEFLAAVDQLVKKDQALRFSFQGQVFGLRCTGPLQVTGQGRIVWPAGAAERHVRVE